MVSQYLPNPFNREQVIGLHTITLEVVAETQEDAIAIMIARLEELRDNPPCLPGMCEEVSVS